MMKNEAQKQFESISIAQIKDTLKKISSDKFDKMIITDGQSIKRCNYVFAKLKYQKIERQATKIKFPLYGAIKDNFAEIEGGLSRFGEKSKLNSERILEVLQKSYSTIGQSILNIDAKSPFVFPIETENNEIAIKQSKYFFPDLTYKETCDECNGNKYITCQDSDCNGRHKWTCTDCNGDGKLTCEKCAGRKKVDCSNCNGSNRVKCKRCGGDGRVNDGFIAKTADSKYAQEKRCGDCAGKGYVQCRDCTSGQVSCRPCSGNGKVSCGECSAQGTITCSLCYSDKERYGKINCPQCQTEGITAQIVYVSTIVSSTEIDKFILEGTKLNINETQLQSHINQQQRLELIYKKVNEDLKENYDEYSKIYAENFERDLGLNKDGFPLLTKEEIYYQVFPCVELSYKHMLTNTIHEFTIIDFWDKPEVIFHSEPEQLKQDLGNATKAVGGFFGKLFKTKGFKTKEDKRNEIVLLIHLAKVDGKIEDQEKVYLSEMIGTLDDFTNSEKQKLFDVMNSVTLPELTKADVTFSSKERGQEVLSKLTELANADGEMEALEKTLIDKIKNMM
jgi:uncharacterized tellurite resistance protein B-like protein